MRAATLAIGVSGLLVLTACASPQPTVKTAAESDALTVYVRPGGASVAGRSGEAHADSAGSVGITAQTAVGSLTDAQAVIAARRAKNVTVVLHGGTYHDADMRWTAGTPDETITVAPQAGTGPVVFDGQAAKKKGYWTIVTPKSAKLVFKGPMTIRNYGDGGIKAQGNKTDGPVRGLVIKGITFTHLGNAWVKGGNGYAAVHLNYVEKPQILNNKFSNLENTVKPGNMHAVYFAFNPTGKTPGSNHGLVQGNTFQVISGDPIRASDGSSYNVARSNVFKTGKDHKGKTRGNGYKGIFTYWVFSRANKCGKGNKFYGNKTYRSYSNATIPAARSGADTGRKCTSVTRSGD
ncbi:right-handed parallel beta-helix repeat-containing protein [Actinoallomurus sp. NPDC052308]|uniref:right-handed parallel beta-helix repeat-containing protein n=1 Tax=Actinoallomurus sp. NPDC052308 TaxID=3155530 RepID=UPI00341F3F34